MKTELLNTWHSGGYVFMQGLTEERYLAGNRIMQKTQDCIY